jgi:hypothetical protein
MLKGPLWQPTALLVALLAVAAFFLNLFTTQSQTSNQIIDNMSASRVSRSIVKQVLAVEQSEGVGARVRRSIGSMNLRNLTPFLMSVPQFSCGIASLNVNSIAGLTTLQSEMELGSQIILIVARQP